MKEVPESFERAANLILDTLEEAFHLKAPHGRDRVFKSIVDVLDYYTIPRDITFPRA